MIIINKYPENHEIVKDMESIRKVNRHYVWENFMRKYNCQIICEIGVQRGNNFQEMIKHSPVEAVAIDSWIDDGVIGRNDSRFPQNELDKQYTDFLETVKDKPFVKTLREYSFDAASHFEDNHFDLVYIDGDHTFEGCSKDIEVWYPKVKAGGFLMGDDYRIYGGRTPGVTFGVIEAVQEYSRKNKLKFYLLPNYGWAYIKT